MNCDKIRGSNLDAFDMCQLMYRYTCHERKIPDILIPKWAIIGWVVHKACEISLQENVSIMKIWKDVIDDYANIVMDEVLGTWPQAKIDLNHIPPFPKDGMKRISKMLINFDRMRPFFHGSDRLVTERGFCINLVEDSSKPLLFTGRIDLTLHKGGDIHIVDFKSSQPKWEHKTVPPQLLRYAIALSIMENIPMSKITVHLFNLESGNIHERVFSAREANLKIDEMIDKIEKIRSMSPRDVRPNIGSHCRTLCGYSPSCPAYQSYRSRQ